MFKVGDTVECVDNSMYEHILSIGERYTVEGTHYYEDYVKVLGHSWYNTRFKLVKEEQTMKLKQNWSIRVHSKEQAEVYEKTLIALGYILTDDSDVNHWRGKVKCLYNTDYFWYSPSYADIHFDNLESFLAWHFQEEETEQQKQIRELEETIQKAQQQIEQLKKGLCYE